LNSETSAHSSTNLSFEFIARQDSIFGTHSAFCSRLLQTGNAQEPRSGTGRRKPSARQGLAFSRFRLGLWLPFVRHYEYGHFLPFHHRWPFQLPRVSQFLQDRIQPPSAFLLMLHLAAAEQDRDLALVVVFEELAGLGNLGVDVVLASLGADADLLQ